MSAVRFIAGAKRLPGTLQLQLRVKPGAHKNREGVSAVTDESIELCVAAPPKNGEANKAVVRLLSDLIGLPTSRFHLTHGSKSKDKTVLLAGVEEEDGPAYAASILELLRKAGR